jgi:hypothetical protein
VSRAHREESPHGRWQGDSDSGALRSRLKATLARRSSRHSSMSSLNTHLLHSRPQKSPPDTDINEIPHSILVDGAERVLSYGGTSQYNRDGTGASACGLAALNFARIVFSMEQGGLQNTALLQAVLARECAEVCQLHSILPSERVLTSKGNRFYLRIVVWKPSSRSRRYLPRSLV